jgi:mannosyltransferase OCH1-like enzyme
MTSPLHFNAYVTRKKEQNQKPVAFDLSFSQKSSVNDINNSIRLLSTHLSLANNNNNKQVVETINISHVDISLVAIGSTEEFFYYLCYCSITNSFS